MLGAHHCQKIYDGGIGVRFLPKEDNPAVGGEIIKKGYEPFVLVVRNDK